MLNLHGILSLALALALAARAPSQDPADEPPDLQAVPLPVLELTRDNPETLWSFLIDPATPYAEARAAALRCREVFSLELLRTLQRARCELRHEYELHGFGVLESPRHSRPFLHQPQPTAEPERRILGRAWTIPDQPTPYPDTWAEEARAPWPWRVHKILERTWWTVVPRSDPGPRTQAWLDECMRWPIDNDRDAQMFVEASAAAGYTKTLPVLARWRSIALDERFPLAAARLTQTLGEAHRLMVYGTAEARLACQVLAADVLRHSPHEQARQQCAYGLYSMRRFMVVGQGFPSEVDGPPPVEALIAAAELAIAPHAEDPSTHWTHLYVYAFSVLGAVDDPPFAPERNMKWDSPEVPKLLQRFETWFEEQRPALEAKARRRAEAVARVRKQLIELEEKASTR